VAAQEARPDQIACVRAVMGAQGCDDVGVLGDARLLDERKRHGRAGASSGHLAPLRGALQAQCRCRNVNGQRPDRRCRLPRALRRFQRFELRCARGGRRRPGVLRSGEDGLYGGRLIGNRGSADPAIGAARCQAEGAPDAFAGHRYGRPLRCNMPNFPSGLPAAASSAMLRTNSSRSFRLPSSAVRQSQADTSISMHA